MVDCHAFEKVCVVSAAVMRVHCVEHRLHVNAVGSVLPGYQASNGMFVFMQRTMTDVGALANGASVSEATDIANKAVSDVQGLSEGASSGRRHLLQV